MAKTHQRVFALIAAILFLATSVATGAIVVWQITKDNQQSKEISELQSAASELRVDDNINQEQGDGMLKGSKLQEFTPVGEAAELQIIDIQEGTGAVVAAGDTVTAHYTGAYAVNGEIFESSKDGGQPATFPLANVIQGWQQGVPGMKVGGIRRLVIPGSLAYGDAPEGYVPGSGARPMGTLVFDIELVGIGE